MKLHLPPEERDVLQWAFTEIYFHDCYGLGTLSQAPATILDVGGNVGFFSMVARHHYPHATIHCYEPNRALSSALEAHLAPFNVRVFLEGVGLRAGRVRLELRGGSLHSVTKEAAGGDVVLTSFATAVDRIGNQVDLLKLDCEGAEWEILQDAASLRRVKMLTMEYHLWARPGSSVQDLEALLARHGFMITHHQPIDGATWGLMWAQKR